MHEDGSVGQGQGVVLRGERPVKAPATLYRPGGQTFVAGGSSAEIRRQPAGCRRGEKARVGLPWVRGYAAEPSLVPGAIREDRPGGASGLRQDRGAVRPPQVVRPRSK